MATTRVCDLIAITARLSKLSVADIVGLSRAVPIVRARQAVCHVAVSQGVHSTPQIGKVLGGRDHSTIVHANRKAKINAKRDPEYAHFIERIKAEALVADPFLDGWGEQFEFPLPVAKPIAAPVALRPVMPPKALKRAKDGDGDYDFHRGVAAGSANLLAALRAM